MENAMAIYRIQMLDATDLSGTNGGQIHASFAAWPIRKFEFMRGPFVQQRRNDEQETEEARFLVVKNIRDAILDETFKPGERLPEEQVGKMFNVSRSPVREVLLALEKEGTVVMERDIVKSCVSGTGASSLN